MIVDISHYLICTARRNSLKRKLTFLQKTKKSFERSRVGRIVKLMKPKYFKSLKAMPYVGTQKTPSRNV